MKKLQLVFVLLLTLLMVGCTKSYTVSFVPNNGEALDAITVEKGANIVLPTVTKTGYNFGGWYVDSEFNTGFNPKDTIDSSLTLYAKWNIKVFTVVFKNDDDTVIATRENVPYGSAAVAPADPVKVGYQFTGWDTAFSNVESNLNVKAQFVILTYNVQFYDDEGEALGAVQVIEHGSAATAPADPEKVGYEFTGWDQTFSEVTSTLDIHPVFERLVYTVEFQDSDGTRIGEVQNVNYGEGATAPADPSKTGYAFDGWDDEFSNVTQNLVVKAVYIAIEYDITYYDGASVLTHEPKKYTIASSYSLVEYAKVGHLFMGWYDDASFTNKVESIALGSTGPKTFYGKWLDESQTYTLNYELNGGGWTWTAETVTVPGSGIDANSNLPEQLMADFYYYLKQNNLLTSAPVAVSLQKTTWDTFKANYTDPVAIYNHTTTNTSSATNGYSQFFYTTATGNTSTHLVTTITDGFFGTEPYKTKYANLISHLSVLMFLKGYNTEFWEGASAKSLAGFVLDGYFYGTQGAGTGNFALLRGRIPNTNLRLVLSGDTLTEEATPYALTSYIQGLSAKLVAPIKDGYVFAGWYDNASFTGDPVWEIASGVAPASMYYAKWIAYAELD